MNPEFIQSHIKRGNRNLLVIGLLLTIVGSVLAAVSWFPALIAVPGLFALGAWLRRIVSPDSHPIYKQLARYGDVQTVVQQVNRDFSGAKASGITNFGETWLAQGDTYGVSIVPWSDIAWLHIYTKAQGGVRTSCYVRVWSRDGKQFVAPAGVRPGEVEQLLEDLRARAPWAEVGYSAEMQQLWNKRREDFLKRVDARISARRANFSAGTNVASDGRSFSAQSR